MAIPASSAQVSWLGCEYVQDETKFCQKEIDSLIQLLASKTTVAERLASIRRLNESGDTILRCISSPIELSAGSLWWTRDLLVLRLFLATLKRLDDTQQNLIKQLESELIDCLEQCLGTKYKPSKYFTRPFIIVVDKCLSKILDYYRNLPEIPCSRLMNLSVLIKIILPFAAEHLPWSPMWQSQSIFYLERLYEIEEKQEAPTFKEKYDPPYLQLASDCLYLISSDVSLSLREIMKKFVDYNRGDLGGKSTLVVPTLIVRMICRNFNCQGSYNDCIPLIDEFIDYYPAETKDLLKCHKYMALKYLFNHGRQFVAQIPAVNFHSVYWDYVHSNGAIKCIAFDNICEIYFHKSEEVFTLEQLESITLDVFESYDFKRTNIQAWLKVIRNNPKLFDIFRSNLPIFADNLLKILPNFLLAEHERNTVGVKKFYHLILLIETGFYAIQNSQELPREFVESMYVALDWYIEHCKELRFDPNSHYRFFQLLKLLFRRSPNADAAWRAHDSVYNSILDKVSNDDYRVYIGCYFAMIRMDIDRFKSSPEKMEQLDTLGRFAVNYSYAKNYFMPKKAKHFGEESGVCLPKQQ